MNGYCKEFSDDYMVCKQQTAQNNPEKCALEGRKVTRCAMDLISKLEENCHESFTAHWKCLEVGNNYYWRCRSEEKALNICVFQKMVLSHLIFSLLIL
jgi:NADH dehydrogenase (ubiquinone) 1 alpha subcomplex subunit 8